MKKKSKTPLEVWTCMFWTPNYIPAFMCSCGRIEYGEDNMIQHLTDVHKVNVVRGN